MIRNLVVASFAVSSVAAAQGGRQTAGAATTLPTNVRIISDERGYRFEPKEVRIPSGGTVRFVVASGGPHNITFDDGLPPDAAARLQANMSRTMSALSGPMMMSAGESYTISFAGVPSGTYAFHCTPHLALEERGQIVVGQPVGGQPANAAAAPAATAPSPSTSRPPASGNPAGPTNYQPAINAALRALALQSPGSLAGQAAVPAVVRTFLLSMVTAEEAFFADSVRYTASFEELRRSNPDLRPPSTQPIIFTSGRDGWFAVLSVTGGACAVGVGAPNPLVGTAGDGETACRLINAPGRGTAGAAAPPPAAATAAPSKDAFRANLERTAQSVLGYLGTQEIPERGGNVRTGPMSWDYTVFSIDRCMLRVTDRLRVFTEKNPQITKYTVNLAKLNPDKIQAGAVSSRTVYKPPLVKIELANTNYAIVEEAEDGSQGSPSELSLFGSSLEKLQEFAGDLKVLARACSS